MAVAFKSGYVNVYDKNFVFERCIDSGSQDIYVLFVENCLMIYRWKINQYVKFDENFLNQETYDIALTSHNRNQIHKLETKNKMYYNGASYEMQAATSGAYMYLVKIQSNEKNILIDAADAVQKNVSGLLIVILLIMLFGVFALIQNIEKFKIDDEKKCSKYCFGQVEIVYSPSAVGGFCLTF